MSTVSATPNPQWGYSAVEKAMVYRVGKSIQIDFNPKTKIAMLPDGHIILNGSHFGGGAAAIHAVALAIKKLDLASKRKTI